MRKYLVAAAVGAMLIAGPAENSDDRVGGPFPFDSRLQGGDELAILLGGAVLIGLLTYELSHGGKGVPASP